VFGVRTERECVCVCVVAWACLSVAALACSFAWCVGSLVVIVKTPDTPRNNGQVQSVCMCVWCALVCVVVACAGVLACAVCWLFLRADMPRNQQTAQPGMPAHATRNTPGPPHRTWLQLSPLPRSLLTLAHSLSHHRSLPPSLSLTNRYKLGNPNPFAAGDSEELASVAYRCVRGDDSSSLVIRRA
jgi:hypothetical protein